MIVIPAAAVAERRVAEHLIGAGATSPAAAVAYDPTRSIRARALRRLKDADIVRSAGSGYYIDEDAWLQRRADRRKRAAIVAGVAAVVAGIFASL